MIATETVNVALTTPLCEIALLIEISGEAVTERETTGEALLDVEIEAVAASVPIWDCVALETFETLGLELRSALGVTGEVGAGVTEIKGLGVSDTLDVGESMPGEGVTHVVCDRYAVADAARAKDGVESAVDDDVTDVTLERDALPEGDADRVVVVLADPCVLDVTEKVA